jgi:hypothetical protein
MNTNLSKRFTPPNFACIYPTQVLTSEGRSPLPKLVRSNFGGG